jgi:hypothetical protein
VLGGEDAEHAAVQLALLPREVETTNSTASSAAVWCCTDVRRLQELHAKTQHERNEQHLQLLCGGCNRRKADSI